MNSDSDRHRPLESPPRPAGPTFAEAFRFWLKLGFISFGGPTGQIAIMHTELVDRRRWISESRFLHALNYCMLLPGPEAQQLAVYIGWLLHRTWGGIAAGALFVLPSAFILWLLSYIYVTFGNLPGIAATFDGLKPAVMAIVAAAVIRIGKRALKNAVMWTIAAGAFIAIYFFHVPFPIIVLTGGLVGLAGAQWSPRWFIVIKSHGAGRGANEVIGDADESPDHARPTWGRAARVVAVSGLLWWIPVLIVAAWLGPDHALVHEGVFFSKAAMVTFGGAYAVLPYVAQRAVDHYAWLGTGQMMDGLGLAETTPGPLIMVVQFVGFLGAWNHPGHLSPLLAATLGAAITTWVTFLPCFLWIFLGAPFIETMRSNERVTGALSAITAVVVGVVLNLAVWFGRGVILPADGRVDWFAVALAVAAFAALVWAKRDVIAVILASASVGFIRFAFA
ncbi:MAG: chromate efflux transporter [Phycisphaerales bacterium]|nr:chromate efflux transporter [Phycisphaerales bacterium]